MSKARYAYYLSLDQEHEDRLRAYLARANCKVSDVFRHALTVLEYLSRNADTITAPDCKIANREVSIRLLAETSYPSRPGRSPIITPLPPQGRPGSEEPTREEHNP